MRLNTIHRAINNKTLLSTTHYGGIENYQRLSTVLPHSEHLQNTFKVQVISNIKGQHIADFINKTKLAFIKINIALKVILTQTIFSD